MAEAAIKKSHMAIGNAKYFRTSPENVLLGAYGDKVQNAFKRNGFEYTRDFLRMKNIEVENLGIFKISSSKSTSGDFNIGATYTALAKNASGNFSVTYNHLINRKAVLVKFVIRKTADVVKEVNNDRECLDYLNLKSTKRGRVVGEIFVVVDYSYAKEFSTSIKLEGSYDDKTKGFKIKGKGGIAFGGKTELSIPPNSVFAYAMLRPVWDYKQRNKRKKIVDFKRDTWGLS